MISLQLRYSTFSLLLALSAVPASAGTFRISAVDYVVWAITGNNDVNTVIVTAKAVYRGRPDLDDDDWLIQTFLNDSIGNDLDDWTNPDAVGYGLNGTNVPYNGMEVNCDGGCAASGDVPKCDGENQSVRYKGKAGVAIYHQFSPETDIDYGDVRELDCVSFTVGGTVPSLSSQERLYSLNLTNNATDEIFITQSGIFTFPKKLRDGQTYVVEVSQQPYKYRKCYADEATKSGVISGQDVTDVVVYCINHCKAHLDSVHYPGGLAEADARCYSPSFQDRGNGSVADLANNLLWSKTTFWDSGNSAQTACLSSQLGGRTDWYLPDVAQLQTLLPPGTCHSALSDCGSGSPDVPANNAIHWSSSHPYWTEYCPAQAGCKNSFWAVATGLGGKFGVDCNFPGCPPRERVYWMDVDEGMGFVRCVSDLY